MKELMTWLCVGPLPHWPPPRTCCASISDGSTTYLSRSTSSSSSASASSPEARFRRAWTSSCAAAGVVLTIAGFVPGLLGNHHTGASDNRVDLYVGHRCQLVGGPDTDRPH